MEIANFFWDGEMSNLEKNCIKSFVRNGFKVKLWSYNRLIVDGAESCDANLVLDKSYMFNNDIKQHHDYISIEKCNKALFSDRFRFTLIAKYGGWWFDTDCFCLKDVNEYTKIRSNHDLVSFYEEKDSIACGVFYLKKDTIFSNLIIEEFNYLVEIEKGKVSKWATFGPIFLTNFVNKYNLLDGIFDVSFCYSILWYDVDLMLYPLHLETAIDKTKDSLLTHIWTPTFIQKNINKNNPIIGSFLHKLYTIGVENIPINVNILNPKVSIVITCYNYGRFVSDAINSALNQIYSNIEVIVVNDGSNDESHQVISKFTDRITYVNQINTGVATARNNGLQIASGQYCVCLDADDCISPDYISDAVKFISDDSTIVSPMCSRTDENLNIIDSSNWPDLNKLNINKITFRSIMLRNCVSGPSVFPKSKWEQVGGYNPLNPNCEDWEFWINLVSIGCNVLYMNQNNIYFLYREHGPSRFGSVNYNDLWNYHYTKYGIFQQNFSRIEKIQALYKFILQREADIDGLTHYLNSELNIYQLFDSLYNSDEYKTKI